MTSTITSRDGPAVTIGPLVGKAARPSPRTGLRSNLPPPPPTQQHTSSVATSKFVPSHHVPHPPRASSQQSSSTTAWMSARVRSAPVSPSPSPPPSLPQPLIPLVPRLMLPVSTTSTTVTRPPFMVSSARTASATASQPTSTTGSGGIAQTERSSAQQQQQRRQRTPLSARSHLYQRRTVEEAVAASAAMAIRPQTASATTGGGSGNRSGWLSSLRTAPSRTARRKRAAQLLAGNEPPPVGDELLPLPPTATRAILDLDAAATTVTIHSPSVPPSPVVTTQQRSTMIPAGVTRIFSSSASSSRRVTLLPSPPPPHASSPSPLISGTFPLTIATSSSLSTTKSSTTTTVSSGIVAMGTFDEGTTPSGPGSPLLSSPFSTSPNTPIPFAMSPSPPPSRYHHHHHHHQQQASSSPTSRSLVAVKPSPPSSDQHGTHYRPVVAEVVKDEEKEEAAIEAALRPLATALAASKIGGLRRARLLSAERRKIKQREHETATTVKHLHSRLIPPVIDVYGIEVEAKEKKAREDRVYNGQLKWRANYQHRMDNIFEQLHFEAEWERYTGRSHRQVEATQLDKHEQMAAQRLFEARAVAAHHAREDRKRHSIRSRFRELVWSALAASRVQRAMTTRESHRSALQEAARLKVSQLVAARRQREREHEEHQLRLRIIDKQRTMSEYWSGVEQAIAKRRHDLELQRRSRDAKLQKRREMDGLSQRERWRLNAEHGWLRVHLSRAQDIHGLPSDCMPRIQLQLRYANPSLPTRTQYSQHFNVNDPTPVFDTDFSFRVSHAHLQQLSIAIQLPSRALVTHWESQVERKRGWHHKSTTTITAHHASSPNDSPHGTSTINNDHDHDDDDHTNTGGGEVAVTGEVVLRLRDLRRRPRGEFAAALQLADIPGILHVHMRLLPTKENGGAAVMSPHGRQNGGNNNINHHHGGGVADKQTASSIARSPH
jgi:hypothetical protein